MSDHNGNSSIISLGKMAIASMPPAFLLLLLLNTIFLVAVFWFLNSRATVFERAMVPIMQSCMNKLPMELVPHLKSPTPEPLKK